MRIRHLGIPLGLLVGMSISLETRPTGYLENGWLQFLATPAMARGRGHARRNVRRTSHHTARGVARRTTRRVVRRTSVAGCLPRSRYYYCSGVYYRAIVENGKTVYVVVNP